MLVSRHWTKPWQTCSSPNPSLHLPRKKPSIQWNSGKFFFTRKEQQHPSAMARLSQKKDLYSGIKFWFSHKHVKKNQDREQRTMLAVTKWHLCCRGMCWNSPVTFLCDLVLSVTLLHPISDHLQFLLPHVDVPRITGSQLGLPRVHRERGTEAISIKKKCIHRASIHPQDSRPIWVDERKPRASDTTRVKTTAHFASKIQWGHSSWQPW